MPTVVVSLQTGCPGKFVCRPYPRKPLSPYSMFPQTSVCRRDDPMDHGLQTGCPHRPLSADTKTPQTSFCRPNAPTDVCLQTRCPQLISVCRCVALTLPCRQMMPLLTAICRPDAQINLCLQTRSYHRPLSAESMPPQTSVCRPDFPIDHCMQTRFPLRLCLSTRCPCRPMSPNLIHP